MSLKLSLDLPEDGSYVRMARRMGRLLLEEQHISDTVIEDIELVLGELCTNVIHHARSHAGHFQVTLEYQQDRVVITVIDQGTGFSRNDVAEPGTERSKEGEAERFGGFGLPIVEILSDRLEFERSDPMGTVVRAEMLLNEPKTG